MNMKKMISVSLSMGIIVFALTSCHMKANQPEGSETAASIAPSASEPARKDGEGNTDGSAKTSESNDKSEEYTTGKKGDEYILPAAKSHVYTRKELSAWYKPSIDADDFNAEMLSQTESDNLKAILKMEEMLAYGVISCPKIGSEEFPVIDGSTATLPLSQAVYRLAAGATAQEAEAHIQHNKTTQAYLNLIQGRDVDLVIANEPGESVKESLERNGDNIVIKPIGRDALVFMANGKNPVNTLTQQQVLGIYTGTFTNWKELGGRNQEIKAFQRPRSSGSQNLMEKLVMKGNKMADGPSEYVFSEMEGVIGGLASYDNTGEALGYSVFYYAKNMYEKPELKFMGIDGVVPSNDTIRNGSYPYANNFYAAIRKDEPKDSQAYQLFEWLTSDDGQALINALGYVGIKEVKKALPEGFEDSKEDYPGEIPLDKNEVILGKGEYLYGQSGIGVFDRKMRLLKFIEHVQLADENNFFLCSSESPLPMLDTLSGKFGLYSIREGRWICDPVYSYVYPVEDGFEMERFTWIETEGQKRDQITYDYADSQGRLVRTDVSEEERDLEAESGRDFSESYAYNRESFAQQHPEILALHDAVMDDIDTYGVEESKFSVTDRKGMCHFYDSYGTPLFSFDMTQLDKKASAYPSIVNEHVSYLTADFKRGGKYIEHLYVFRDGILFKELTSEEKEWVDSYLNDIIEKSYTRIMGNYLYVYNYQDELCAKFLRGYLLE